MKLSFNVPLWSSLPVMDAGSSAASKRFQFNDLILDTGSRQVTRQGETLKLGALTFDLLLVLVEAAPALVSYDALAERVWRGRPVTPETIAQRAKLLRDALGDDAKSPRYFELIRGQGYRLLSQPESVTDQPPRSRGGSRRGLYLMLIGLAALIGIGLLLLPQQQSASLAVLPFKDLSPAGDQGYLADGVAEELITHLTGLDGLAVANRSQSFSYRDPQTDSQAIGAALGVRAILEGSVRTVGDELRVAVQLVDVDSGYALWAADFDRRVEDMIAVQEDIAVSVASALGVQLGVGGVNDFMGAGTRNLDAYEALISGDSQKALTLDPNYAAAWGARGLELANNMYENMPKQAPAIIQQAYNHVAHAIALDPGSAKAHADFATLIYTTWDWPRAERAFAESMSLRRDPYNLAHYANMMMRTGRSSAALAIHQQRETMLRNPEPLSWRRINVDIALERFDSARALAALQPESLRPYSQLVVAMNAGDRNAVRAAVRGLPDNALFQELYGPLLDLIDTPEKILPFLQSLAADSKREWPAKYSQIALAAAYFGHAEFALQNYLEEARYTPIRFGGLWFPIMAEARSLPAFKPFLREVGLENYWREYGWSDFCRPLGREDFTCTGVVPSERTVVVDPLAPTQ